MGTQQVVVTQLQEAFHENPGQLQDAVYQSGKQAADGAAEERAQLIAVWDKAVSVTEGRPGKRDAHRAGSDCLGCRARMYNSFAQARVNPRLRAPCGRWRLWTGIYGAPAIAASIQKLNRCDVVLDVGDTCYSGADDEIHDRLAGDWPVRDGNIKSRALNSNRRRRGQSSNTALGLAPAFVLRFDPQGSCAMT